MQRIIVGVLVVLMLTSAPLFGCQDQHAEARSALQDLLDQQVEEQDILGMIMAVRLADGTVIYVTSGSTDPSGKVPWTVDTVSALASVTKTFTGVVVMQLVEEGKLSLDDTIDTWFPEQPNGDRITIRMVLSHTSGIPNYNTALGNDVEKWTREWTPEDLIAEANKLGPVSEPGSSEAHYSNTNYFVLGLIIEKITGHSWAQEVESRIITPLGLRNTSFMDKEGVWGGILVPGYSKTASGYVSTLELPYIPDASTRWAAGSIVCSASDLMTFAGALFDGELVSNATLATMAQPLGRDLERGALWGLGGGTLEQFERAGFGMVGDTIDYHASFFGYLDSKLTVVALTNDVEGDVISACIAALEYISQ